MTGQVGKETTPYVFHYHPSFEGGDIDGAVANVVDKRVSGGSTVDQTVLLYPGDGGHPRLRFPVHSSSAASISISQLDGFVLDWTSPMAFFLCPTRGNHYFECQTG